MKKVLTIILLCIAGFGAIIAVRNRDISAEPPKNVTPAPALATSAVLVNDHLVKVTYFTTNVRCPSCLKIEKLTRQTVQNRFAGEVAEGKVVFQLINTDLPENHHFIDDYQLVSKTVVVAEFNKGQQGEWFNLQDVWLKFSDPESFETYVASAVKALL